MQSPSELMDVHGLGLSSHVCASGPFVMLRTPVLAFNCPVVYAPYVGYKGTGATPARIMRAGFESYMDRIACVVLGADGDNIAHVASAADEWHHAGFPVIVNIEPVEEMPGFEDTDGTFLGLTPCEAYRKGDSNMFWPTKDAVEKIEGFVLDNCVAKLCVEDPMAAIVVEVERKYKTTPGGFRKIALAV